MAKNLEEKTLFSGEKVKVVGPEYEEGMPEQAHEWRRKIQGRQEMLNSPVLCPFSIIFQQEMDHGIFVLI